MKGPRLSIVVPFFNVEHYIGDCLDSIAMQSFRDFEVILVDDGSQDASSVIAKAMCDQDPRFRIVVQDNQGLGPARNTGTNHAQGDFITFVDSDDLVTRHAYEIMLHSLDETGSSLVGGDARRFDSSGVRESFAHRVPFAQDRKATHITEFPALTFDRMVWNKIYRRSFWDQFGYRFPAIRYEDYPVTLKAHLDAVTVDCLAAPVYYWRVRELGQSITQRKHDYDNLLDRVVSAEMVLDLLDTRPRAIRLAVHRQLAEIDLSALVQAFATVPEKDLAPLLALGRRIAHRLDSRALELSTTFDRLQFHALRRGASDLLKSLAEFRLAGGLRGGARARRSPLFPWRFENQYPGIHDRGRQVPRKMYRLPPADLTLETSVTNVSWSGNTLVVRGTAEIRHLRTTGSSALQVSVGGADVAVPVSVTRFEALDLHAERALVGFELLIEGDQLAAVSGRERVMHFIVRLTNGRLTRSAVLRGSRAGSAVHPPAKWVTDDVWLQPRLGADGRFAMVKMDQPWRLTDAILAGDSLIVSGVVDAGAARPRLVLSRVAGQELSFPVVLEPADGDVCTFSATVALERIVDAANPDDPFTQRTSRLVKFASEAHTRPLVVAGLDRSVRQVHASRLIGLTRSPGGLVQVDEGPVRVWADEVDLHRLSSALVVRGVRWPSFGVRGFLWRHFLSEDEEVDRACELTFEGDRWAAALAPGDLVLKGLPVPEPSSEGGGLDWTLFALNHAGEHFAVLSDAFLSTRLPFVFEHENREFEVNPRVNTVHVIVR